MMTCAVCTTCGRSRLLLLCSDTFTFSVDQIFREANISTNGMVKYEEFVKIVCAPVPDYY